MAIIAKASGGNFIPAPAGAHSAVCCDVVDMGMLEVSFGGKTKTQHKIRIVWQIEEVMADNRPFIAQKRYTLSLHEKAALRKDLESWRGRAFSDTELEGFDVEVLLGKPCLLNVIQENKAGKTYSNVTSIMKLPKSMQPLTVRDYVRVVDRQPEPAQQPEGHEARWEPSWEGNFPDITDEDVPF